MTVSNTLLRKDLLVILAIAFAVAATLVGPSRRDLVVGDETKYGQVIRETRASGAWFLPTLGGEPFTHKPPVHFWLIGLLTFPLGVYSTWAFVLPAIAAYVFLLWVLWRMGGPLAAFVCGTALMVWLSAQTARMDVSFTATLTLGIWMLRRFLDEGDRRALLWCGVWVGIATLIKGPMAPVIAIVLFLFECWRRRSMPRANYFPALAAMIVIPMLWLVPAMLLGGGTYTNEVIMKQTVGRAVASWVHRAPPWYYLLHMPGAIFPWFLVALVALRGGNRFYLSWIAAVLVPYSLMSSKLDVYMMALIPPVAMMIADRAAAPAARIANIATLSLLALLIVATPCVKGRDAALLERADVRGFFITMTVAAVIAIIVSLLRPPVVSTIALGLVPVVAFTYVGIVLMPLVNEMATTRPLIAALERQGVPPEQMALYTCPYLWSRDFPRELERVRYVNADNIADPVVIATSRAHSSEIAGTLQRYRKVDQVRMIGKWFDVYRR